MTDEKYIYERNYGYVIIKKIENKNRTLGVFKSLDEAIFARELLLKYDWNLD